LFFGAISLQPSMALMAPKKLNAIREIFFAKNGGKLMP
jgi:hypothetical protein